MGFYASWARFNFQLLVVTFISSFSNLLGDQVGSGYGLDKQYITAKQKGLTLWGTPGTYQKKSFPHDNQKRSKKCTFTWKTYNQG